MTGENARTAVDSSLGTQQQLAPPGRGETRRRFMKVCIGGMTIASAGTIAYPVLSFLRLPERQGSSQAVEISMDTLKEDQAVYRQRGGVTIVVIYTDRVPKAFDASCTHLGCIVAWDGTQHLFRCPCHGAVFDDQGRAVSGPVSKPLRTVKMKMEAGKLVIT
jgi:cytochrome b6-f complex iron-sulfur subunit